MDTEDIVSALGMDELPRDGDYYDWEAHEIISKKLSEKLGTHYTYGVTEECESILIGMSYSSLKDDETGEAFKKRAEQGLKKIFGDKISFNFICTEIHDG